MTHPRPIGIFSWFGFPMPLEERLHHIARAGFDATALWLGREEPHVRSGNLDGIPAMARRCELAIDNVHAPFSHCNDLWAADRGAREAWLDEMTRCVDFCERHAIPVVVIHVCQGASPPPINAGGLETLTNLVQRAEDAGVVLAVENTARPDYINAALQAVESPCLGMCYDSSHDFLAADNPGRLLQQWGHRLVATHFSDNGGVMDNHWLPGDGRIDWQRVAQVFPRDTYEGTILLETVVRDDSYPSADAFLAEAHARATSLRDRLAAPAAT